MCIYHVTNIRMEQALFVIGKQKLVGAYLLASRFSTRRDRKEQRRSLFAQPNGKEKQNFAATR